MQAYDLIMIIVLGIATILGAIKGFAWQVASLASILVSYLVAVNFRFDLAKMIQAAPPWNMFLAMLILYVGTSFVIWVGFRLLSSAIDGIRLKEFDRHLGAAFGLAKGAIICLLITMFAMTLLGPKQQEAICRSKSGYYMASALDNASGVLPKELHDVIGPYLDRLDKQLHQQFPADSQNDGSWANWVGGGQPASDQGGSGLGAGLGSVFGGAAGANQQEQGAGSGFNLWPQAQPNSAPTAFPNLPTPAQFPMPQLPQQNQNLPPMIAPPPGSFGYGDGSRVGNDGGLQQAQLPQLLPR